VSWAASVDPEGGAVLYTLQVSYGGAFTEAYSGANTSCVHTPPANAASAVYRVKAADPAGNESAYRTGGESAAARPPVIAADGVGIGGALGAFAGEPPQVAYTATDPEGGDLEISESLDGAALRSFSARSGSQQSATIGQAVWAKTLNGAHSMSVEAEDADGLVDARTFTFTKDVREISYTSRAHASEAMPVSVSLSVQGFFPQGSSLEAWVANNAFDAAPAWEDATGEAASGREHVFANASKEAASWGLAVKVHAARGTAAACRVTRISGFWRQ
jgi:hypothetical protein